MAIDPEYHWKEIDADTPRGVKLQLINKSAGVAVYGVYMDSYCTDPYFTHWSPLPTFKKNNDVIT